MTAPRAAGALRQAPRRFSRGRIAFFRAVEHTLAFLGGRRFYRRRWLRRGRFRVRREIVRVPALPAALEGFTIAQLSDLHLGLAPTESCSRRSQR